jgi:vancomycin resistance protein YoaR
VTVTVADRTFSLIPAEVGFSLDVDKMLAEALENGRRGGIVGQFGWWLGDLTGGEPEPVALVTGYSRQALDAVLDRWVVESIDNPAFEGGIDVVNGEVRALYPQEGIGIDHDESAEIVASALVDLDRTPVDLPTQVITPTRTAAQLDALVARYQEDATALIESPVTLSWLMPPVSVRFETELLESSLRARLSDDTDEEVEFYFDPDPLITYLLGIRSEIEQPPLDAQIVAREDEQLTIIPGRSELLIDELGVSSAVLRAARSATRAGVFPFKEGQQPDLTTQEAEDLHVDELLYRATTFFSPGGDEKNRNRVKNIQRIAEEADGALVMPGETWSLNDYVGRRTEEDGYFRAGAIIGPTVQCCDHPANVGGGVSQFATTLYNAVFFSGMEDVSHTPHTLYFSRYPMGREATLGFPTPDVVFRNNTEAAVLIDTETTDDSVTVRFYGNNGGLEIEAGLSDQRNWVDPFDLYEANPDMDPNAEPEQTSTGKPGFTVTVFRYTTFPPGHPRKPEGGETTETWVWTYDPFPNVYEVHPCKLPEDHSDYVETCPSGVPSVLNLTQQQAENTITSAGYVLGGTATVGNENAQCVENQSGKVIAQSPAAGEWLAPEGKISITLCEWTEPPPEP